MELDQHSDDSASLRIVLLGPTSSGKTVNANGILGRKAFPESPTTACNSQRGEFQGRDIWVIDTPGLSESEEVKREIQKSSTLGPAVPTAFLLVIDLSKKNDGKWKQYLQLIQKIFGRDALMYILVLFTHRDELTEGEAEKLMNSEDKRDLIGSCEGRYHVFNTDAETETSQVCDLMEKIDIMMGRRALLPKNWLRKKSAVRIVLLGKTGAGKSASGNTILGKEAFKEDTSSESVTVTCQKQSKEDNGRHITLIDTPGLFDTKKDKDELKSEIEKCVELSVPGPHVFLLVIRLDARFTEEESSAVKWILGNLGERAMQFTMVLFTHADQLKGRSVEQTINIATLNIIKDCAGGYHVINNLERDNKTHDNNSNRDDQSQVVELLEKIDDLVEKNEGECYTKEMYQEAQQKIREEEERRRDEMSAMRIVLLGKTGSGKSAAGNTILGREAFEEKLSSKSVTETCNKQLVKVADRAMALIDTPGLFGTERSKDEMESEIEKCVNLSLPVPHAFLLVIRLDVRFTEEEKNAVKWIQENFGEEAFRYTIVLLTHGDVLGVQPVEDFLHESPVLSSLIAQCGGRYHTLNNTITDSSQVRELKEKIETMLEKNGGCHYTCEIIRSLRGK